MQWQKLPSVRTTGELRAGSALDGFIVAWEMRLLTLDWVVVVREARSPLT